ncbi:MAG: hypothetical protein U5K00_07620 [Melioribacteraceae bacterium]|nr:hypothetical protein [Melioribacteraceae bacterium]
MPSASESVAELSFAPTFKSGMGMDVKKNLGFSPILRLDGTKVPKLFGYNLIRRLKPTAIFLYELRESLCEKLKLRGSRKECEEVAENAKAKILVIPLNVNCV